MKYNSEIHNHRSLRLQGYDYTRDGLYFITICEQNRECLLGRIEKNEMILGTIGEIANQYWSDISIHFQHVVMHEHIIMPNHVHGIIELSQSNFKIDPSGKRWCNKNDFRRFQWQSRFFDHIIRSEDDFMRIADYIVDNPAKWREDELYQQ